MMLAAWSHHEPPLRLWVAITGTLLLLQGVTSLVVDLAGLILAPLLQAFIGDPLHASIHVVWGIAMLVALRVLRQDRALARVAVVFGCFYVGLAILGVLVYHPFGLLLGPGENAFHFLVGPASLVLGAWGLVSDTEAALPGGA